MAMTREERATRDYLAEKLGEQGYATYAKLFMLFDLRLTSDPRYVGFMEPGKGRITLNRTLAEHQMGLIIRHEILHEYLSHEMRLLDHLAEKNPDLDPDEVSLKKILYSDDTFNIAADYEISNRGYTERDKQDVRAIKLGGQVVSGLVTEDQHPDWVDKTVEEMYDLLKDEREKAKEEAEQQMSQEAQGGEGQSQDSQSGDEGEGAQGEDNQEQSGESSDDGGSNDEQSDEGSSGDQDEQSGDRSSEEQNGSNGDQSDEQGDEGDSSDSSGDASNDSQESSGEGSGNDQDSSQDAGDKGQKGNQGSSSNNGGDFKVIRGTFKNGKFYGLDGKEIIPR